MATKKKEATETYEPKEIVIREVEIEVECRMPIIIHADNIDWADEMEEWRSVPENKKMSKAGDDRTPAYTWFGALYFDDFDDGKVVFPSENIMACLMDGGAQVPTGKGRATFKSQTQSGMVSRELFWEFFNNGKPIMMADIQKMKTLPFKQHVEACRDLGFELFVKRVGVGDSKHVRVRPKFNRWSLKGALLVSDDMITDKVLATILDISGRLKGLGNWRPSAPKRPGPFGTFRARIVSSKIVS